ncbi:hypothetical protein [Ferruginibacter sp.]
MKSVPTILFILLSFLAKCQINPLKDTFNSSLSQPRFCDSILSRDAIGKFSFVFADVLSGSYYFDSNMKFRRYHSGCFGSSFFDSGKWYNNKNYITLINCRKKKSIFYLFKVDTVYFFVAKQDREKFLSSFKSAWLKVNKDSKFYSDKENRLRNIQIIELLKPAYYSKNNSTAGT